MSSKPSSGLQPNTHACHPSSSTSRPTSKTALDEASKRAVIAVGKAAEYLLEKENLKRKLNDHRAEAANLVKINEDLTAENEILKDCIIKSQKHSRYCENVTRRAQNDAQNAIGDAKLLIDNQKGRLRNMKKRCEIAAREIKEWKETYGCKVEGDPSSSTIRTEEDVNSIGPNMDPRILLAGAEARATKYKTQRDTLRRILQDRVLGETKPAESPVLRNAKMAESMESRTADHDGASKDGGDLAVRFWLALSICVSWIKFISFIFIAVRLCSFLLDERYMDWSIVRGILWIWRVILLMVI